MPLSKFNTQTDFSTQVKQYTGTTATLSGNTNILGSLKVKSIEIDTTSPTLAAGNVLVYDGNKFIPAPSDTYGSSILNGMLLTYNSALTYNVSEGGYRINGITYDYTGGSVTIVSGNNLYNRFDVVFVTGYSNTFVKSGTPLFAPTVPTLNSTQLQVGIISVPANFTGGTGSTVIQITSDTVFQFFPTGTGIQRAGSNNAEAVGQYSFALSRDAKAYGQDSIALGLGVKASGNSQTVVGQYNDPNTTDAFIVGNGTSDGSRANAFKVTTGGSAYVTNKLFVTNIEIETTGASANQALVFDGSKFKPQTVTGSGGISGLTSAGTGNIHILSSRTDNRLVYKTISAGTGINDTLVFANTGITSGTSLGSGVNVLFSSNTTNLTFATLSSQTPSTLSIFSSSTGVILFSAITSSASTTSTGITSGTSLGDGVKVLFSSDTTNLGFVTLSSQTPSTLSIISSSTGVILFSAITSSGGTSLGNGFSAATSVGNGLGVISSNTNNELKLFSLSSVTPSTLSVVSSTTGVILFSADTTLDRVTINGNITTNNIKVSQISGTSIFLSSGFTFISGYNSYSNPSELRFLLADDLGSQESKTDIYQLNYFTENITKGINPLTRGVYSAFTGGPIFGYVRTGTSITVGKESFVKITGITSGDTAIGTVFRNRFETQNYNASNTLDNTTKNLIGTAFFNQFDSSKFNQTPVVGTLLETHLLGNQQPTFHNEVRNLQLGFFNRSWTYTTSTQTYFDLYVNRPLLNKTGFNGYDDGTDEFLRLNKHAAIFVESRKKIALNDDVLGRPLTLSAETNIIFENTPWSLFAEADRAYIGNTLVLASAQTLSSTTRGAWLDIGASQATRPHINLSAGTDVSSPQIGDLWWNGNELYFRQDSTTNVNLLRNNPTSKVISATTNGIIALGANYLYDRITLTSSTASITITSITANASISSYTPSIRFFAETDLNVTFRNSDIIKTEGGLDALISGSTYDNITFEYNPISEKFYQTNINNYI